MQTKMLKAAGMFGLVMVLFGCAISAGQPASRGSSDQPTLQPVRHADIGTLLNNAETPAGKPQAIDAFRTYPKTQRLETLAYALSEGTNIRSAVQMIIDDKEMHDRRLASFLAKTMQAAKDHDLFLSVVAANRLPADQTLLAPLIEHALESEYIEVHKLSGNGRHVEFIYNSVFAEAAEAIYRVTDGRMGSENVRRDKTPSEQEKKALIQKWRQTWNAERKPEK
jgi:hypothetical protein